MKKNPEIKPQDDEMLPEYDFSKGVRGKHFKSYRQGHKVVIHKADGSIDVQYFKLAEGAVMLDPDIKKTLSKFRSR